MYAINGNIYHQYTPNVSIYTIHGSYGLYSFFFFPTVTLSQIGIETADSEICIVGGPHEAWGAGLGPRP